MKKINQETGIIFWNALEEEGNKPFRVIDPEDGSNLDEARVMMTPQKEVIIYVDETDGYSLLTQHELEGLELQGV